MSGVATSKRIAGDTLDLEATLALAPGLRDLPEPVAETAWIELRYGGYLAREARLVERLQRHRDLRLPDDLDYATIATLSWEGRTTLARLRPRTLGEAQRLSGVRQADVEMLHAVLQARRA